MTGWKRRSLRALVVGVSLFLGGCAEPPRAERVLGLSGQVAAFASDAETDEVFALVANPTSFEHDLVHVDSNGVSDIWVSGISVLSGDARYTRVAVGNQFVFWMDRSGVHAIDRQTREQRLLSDDGSVELALALSEGVDHVAWVDRGRTKVLYAAGAGGDTRVAATASAPILELEWNTAPGPIWIDRPHGSAPKSVRRVSSVGDAATLLHEGNLDIHHLRYPRSASPLGRATWIEGFDVSNPSVMESSGTGSPRTVAYLSEGMHDYAYDGASDSYLWTAPGQGAVYQVAPRRTEGNYFEREEVVAHPQAHLLSLTEDWILFTTFDGLLYKVPRTARKK